MPFSFLIILFMAGFSAQADANGPGFAIAPDPDLSLAPGGVAALRGVPAFSYPVEMKETLDKETFEFIHGVGPVEEIKIESGDPYMNWFLFKHDGSRIVWAEVGNIYSFAPCLLND